MKWMKGLAVVTLLAFGLIAKLNAQSSTAQITGVVSDTTGAVIPNTQVTLTSQLTGFTRIAATNGEGIYTFPLLTVSVYRVTAEQKGFTSSVRTDIQLNVDQVIRVDFTLKPGEVSEKVEVTEDSATIDTENAAVSSTINQKQVVDLPIESRSWLGLLQMDSGTVYTNGEQGAAQKNQGDAISINGGRPTSNNYSLDGTTITDTNYNTPAGLMSIDAIQEFKVQTSTYSAEYGFSANQINIVSKSGTNDLHGTAFEFYQGAGLNARNAFQTGPNPGYVQNQFGFVAGGPVYIPKLFNGRNKTFFLANYEGLRIRSAGVTSYTFVPQTNWESGNFPLTTYDYSSGLTKTVQIIDPATGTPFANNQVPSSRFSRLAKVAIADKFFPAPNITDSGTIAKYGGNYSYNVPAPNDQNQQTYRVDQNLGNLGQIYGRVTYLRYVGTSTNSITPLGDIFWDQPSWNWQVSHTKAFGANLVNQVRVGWLDTTINSVGPVPPDSEITALGLSNTYQNVSAGFRSWPAVLFNGPGNGLGPVGGAQYANGLSDEPIWDVSDTLNIQRGRHQLVTGIDVRHWTQNRGAGGSQIFGNYTYNGSFTAGTNTTAENVFADFLLGYFDNAVAAQPTAFSDPNVPGTPHNFIHNYVAPFLQDNWQVNHKLTLNLGLRYEYEPVVHDSRNHIMWRDPTNAKGGICVADQKLSPQYTGDNTYYRYCGSDRPQSANSWFSTFAPRVGFAYRFGLNTVFRGGYGLFFDSSEEKEIEGSGLYPYGGGSNISQGPATPNIVTTDGLFPAVSLTGPALPVDNQFVAVILSEHPRRPYSEQWSFGAQQQLGSKTSVEVNYTGTKGTHLLERFNINQATAPSASEVSCYAASQNVNCFTPYLGRRPYPGQNPLTGDWLTTGFGPYLDSSFVGYSTYNAMNVRVQRQTSDLTLAAFYTWAKSLDSKSAAASIGHSDFGWGGITNPYNPRYDYGRSDFDIGQRFRASFLYQFPFGRGKKYLNGISRVANLAVGGWQVNGILSFQQGAPFSVFSTYDAVALEELDGFYNRGSQIGNPHAGQCSNGSKVGSSQCYFNTAAFADPKTGLWGSSGRNAYRSPGVVNLDSSIFKQMIFSERARMELRLESFNTTNHVNLGTPDFYLDDTNFGKINSAASPRNVQLGAKIIF